MKENALYWGDGPDHGRAHTLSVGILVPWMTRNQMAVLQILYRSVTPSGTSGTIHAALYNANLCMHTVSYSSESGQRHGQDVHLRTCPV